MKSWSFELDNGYVLEVMKLPTGQFIARYVTRDGERDFSGPLFQDIKKGGGFKPASHTVTALMRVIEEAGK